MNIDTGTHAHTHTYACTPTSWTKAISRNQVSTGQLEPGLIMCAYVCNYLAIYIHVNLIVYSVASYIQTTACSS